MKVYHRITPSALVKILIVLLMVGGSVAMNQIRAVDADLVVQPPFTSNGNLVIVQGNLIHLSATVGEEVFFSLDLKSPDASRDYSWAVLYPPAHGDVAIETLGQGATGTFFSHPGYVGSDFFAINVCDQFGNTGRVAVTIEILPVSAISNQMPVDLEAFLHIPVVARALSDLAKLSVLNYLDTNPDTLSQVQAAMSLEEISGFPPSAFSSPRDGKIIEKTLVNGPSTPDYHLSEISVALSDTEVTPSTVLLSEVPLFTWVFGSAAVSAAMIAGYYDRTGFPDIYTGPTNGGVIPLTDTLWGSWMDGAGVTYPNNPLAATRNGVDGRVTRGTIDNYWVQYLSNESDPYLTNGWTEHTWGDAIGDYMYTSQSAWGNLDGNTTFRGRFESPEPLSCNEIEAGYTEEDGTLGMRHFYEARGYDVGACYFQYTDNQYAGGFSLDQYKAEIDAGFPVMIHLADHVLVGVGYETGTNMIYIHDTWTRVVNTMEWGGSYQNTEMRAVSIVHPGLAAVPENDAITNPIQITTMPFENAQDTSLATRASDDPNLIGCGLAAGKASVWYSYTPAVDGMLDLDTFGSDYDTVIGVWSGVPDSLTEEACNDDFNGRQSKVFLPVEAGITYYIGISEFKEVLSSSADAGENFSGESKITDISVNKGGMLLLHASDMVTTMPLMEVAPLSDEVWGFRVMPLTDVTLTVGSYSTSQLSDASGEVYFDLAGAVDIVPGTIITIDDSYGSVTYTVAELAITRVSVNDNKVWGTAAYNVSPIWVYACNQSYCVSDGAWTVISNNAWLADFNDIPYDLANGDLIIAAVPDEAGNQTVVLWQMSDPHMLVDPRENSIHVYDWYIEEPDDRLFSHPLELRINGAVIDTCLTDVDMNCVFRNLPVNILAGQLLEVRGDYKIIEHVVKVLKIKLIDPVADTIKGKATPGNLVYVAANEPGNEPLEYMSAIANADGVWLADFSGSVDIAPGSVIHAYVFDQAGNATTVSGHVPVPSFSVDPESEWVDGWDWTPGRTVILSIGAYSGSITVDAYGRFSFDLADTLDIQSGQTIEVRDGLATKTLVVSNLSISEFNEIEDIISGIGDSDSPVLVVAFDDVAAGTGVDLRTDSLGNWQADFSDLEEIGPGTWGWVEQEDGDGDLTVISFTLPDIPVLNSLGKPYAIAGQPAMTLYINGENFDPASVVWWGGVGRDTTFINSTLLSIVLSESDLGVPGEMMLRVDTPPPGGGASTTSIFQVLNVVPQYESKLESNYVDFEWDDIHGATLYKIQLSSAIDFSVLLLNTKTGISNYTAYDLPLLRGKTYYWRVRPFYGDEKGQWSVVMPFDSLDPLSAPELGETVIDGYSVTFNWSPVEGAVKYKLQVSKDMAFTNLIFNAPVLSPETSKLIVFPEKVKTYYWRVRAVDEIKLKSPWSETGQFTVPLQ